MFVSSREQNKALQQKIRGIFNPLLVNDPFFAFVKTIQDEPVKAIAHNKMTQRKLGRIVVTKGALSGLLEVLWVSFSVKNETNDLENTEFVTALLKSVAYQGATEK